MAVVAQQTLSGFDAQVAARGTGSAVTSTEKVPSQTFRAGVVGTVQTISSRAGQTLAIGEVALYLTTAAPPIEGQSPRAGSNTTLSVLHRVALFADSTNLVIHRLAGGAVHH